jgi:hypothetical protein
LNAVEQRPRHCDNPLCRMRLPQSQLFEVHFRVKTEARDGRLVKGKVHGRFCSVQCAIHRVNRAFDPLLNREFSTLVNREKHKHVKPIGPPKERALVVTVPKS